MKKRGEEKMIKSRYLFPCVSQFPHFSLNARAQDCARVIATVRSLRWTTYTLNTGTLMNTRHG